MEKATIAGGFFKLLALWDLQAAVTQKPMNRACYQNSP
jgi:hypothetical protein